MVQDEECSTGRALQNPGETNLGSNVPGVTIEQPLNQFADSLVTHFGARRICSFTHKPKPDR
jgi:hypothetical protein